MAKHERNLRNNREERPSIDPDQYNGNIPYLMAGICLSLEKKGRLFRKSIKTLVRVAHRQLKRKSQNSGHTDRTVQLVFLLKIDVLSAFFRARVH